MAIDTVDTLLGILRRVHLLAPEQVEEVARKLVPYYPNPVELAHYLVQIEWLTPFQFAVLFDGNPTDLVVGPYLLLSPLGKGGVSQVFKAWDSVKGRVVALKVYRHEGGTDALLHFQRERQAVTRLAHVNVIKTFEANQSGGLYYFAMEYVEGSDLHQYVAAGGPLAVEVACEYVRQVALGLQHAHQLGLVHRDIKPANLFLVNPPPPGNSARRGPDPVVKILDWGLARVNSGDKAPPESSRARHESARSQLIGTADYIAPEQARDASRVDIRADIYSLGCTFYYLLTGQPPFEAPTLMAKLMQHQSQEPPSVQQVRPEVPDDVSAMIRKMMAKKAEDRFQIPLLVVATLRRFSLCSQSSPGSVIRPPSATNLSGLLRPSSQTGLDTNVRPSTATNLGLGGQTTYHGTSPRPSTVTNLPNLRPNANGHAAGS
jgi:serine/threonine-protein kinase